MQHEQAAWKSSRDMHGENAYTFLKTLAFLTCRVDLGSGTGFLERCAQRFSFFSRPFFPFLALFLLRARER
jgi:hypothetical protein